MPGLLTSQNITNKVSLIIGTSPLTRIRALKLLDLGAKPIIIGSTSHIASGKIQHIDRPFELEDLTQLGRSEVNKVVDNVFVTLSVSYINVIETISHECERLRIPINVADNPQLCTFTLLSTHTDGDFQFGVSTSGKGCRLANRLRREMANVLPVNIGEICNKVGDLRERLYEEDIKDLKKEVDAQDGLQHHDEIGQEDDDAIQSSTLNTLIIENNETFQQKKRQRIRWLSQVVEYYPLSKLSSISINDLTKEYKKSDLQDKNQKEPASDNTVIKKGKISLIGSGPGSEEFLTTAALTAILTADLILADKLVPSAVLNLVPRGTEVFIAKKFPGNAERAQEELLERGLEGCKRGLYVVRLKQGDPYIFGRGAEEYLFFQKHGFTPDVAPGITSALCAPLAARIPATHRDVADQVLICTGTGRKGVLPNIPEWVETRTTVFLMALHRIGDLVAALETKGWNLDVPCAVIERASCPDQRIIRTTLKDLVAAFESAGSRPPGLLVTGYACNVIEKLSDGEKWRIEEGASGLVVKFTVAIGEPPVRFRAGAIFIPK
ncbi:uroporphyrin-III C-methyltransferase [Nadsonia fulvescens var. elongata DSM 6958]|uniref:Uroporphyrin-III C-methyltransferase n=1 Tax=Nadsonia fulvescens var. elongata DSM 6958 TaxID=857566 RepID=A0A1E3PDJ6_9ASCO|nr:uroporphyrin-III C-methyltransferase [Nadsonia fulvescens var. elongata DSM 6958]